MMESPPQEEDPLMLLRGSWVEVAPLGAPEWPPSLEEEEEAEGELEAILREAQMERGEGTTKGPSPKEEEDGSPPGQREDPERPPLCETLPWTWTGPPETLPTTDLACGPLLSPALTRKEGLQDPPLMLLVVPSLMLSHVLALGLGICIGKRLATSSSSAL
nr:BCL2/adenovirus E1B 19 kDa protein-interacting protein 3-like [Anolis sagrei ordinatus]